MRKMRDAILGGALAVAVALGALVAAPVAARAEIAGVGSAGASSGGLVYLYRLYNPYTGEHLYTSLAEERDQLTPLGWVYEGIGWSACDPDDLGASEDLVPVYRLYNPYAPGGDHHYTTDENEYNELKDEGWIQEGSTWSVPTEENWYGNRTPVYRLYNPNAASGAHHYTTDADEAEALAAAGWIDEGIGWTAVNGREFLLDDDAPEYVRAAAEALEVPDDQYVTYSEVEREPTEDGTIKEGMSSIIFSSDDHVEAATTYLNPDKSVNTEIFFVTWGTGA